MIGGGHYAAYTETQLEAFRFSERKNKKKYIDLTPFNVNRER